MKLIAAAAAAAGLVLIAAAVYLYKKQAPNVIDALDRITPALTASQLPAPEKTSGGIVPADAETKALRVQGDAKLAGGEAAEAESASGKAAANELLKLAISKMAQGKLDDAEKDLVEARARAPKQSLVYYNMAILRLKQGRTDDALKEFEASFMAGFSYFDKLDQDSDLDSLRKVPRFAEMVAKYRPQKK